MKQSRYTIIATLKSGAKIKITLKASLSSIGEVLHQWKQHIMGNDEFIHGYIKIGHEFVRMSDISSLYVKQKWF